MCRLSKSAIIRQSAVQTKHIKGTISANKQRCELLQKIDNNHCEKRMHLEVTGDNPMYRTEQEKGIQNKTE